MAKSIGLIAAACMAVVCFSSGAQQEQDAAPQTVTFQSIQWVAIQITPPRGTLGKVLWFGFVKKKPIVDDGYIIEERSDGTVQYTPISGEFLLIRMSQLGAEAEMRRAAGTAADQTMREVKELMRRARDGQ